MGLFTIIAILMTLAAVFAYPRDVILNITYCVVIFPISVQGLTIGPLVKKSMERSGGTLEDMEMTA